MGKSTINRMMLCWFFIPSQCWSHPGHLMTSTNFHALAMAKKRCWGVRRFVSENSRVGDHGPHRPNFPGMSTILMHSDIVGDLQKIVPSIGEFILPVQCLSQLSLRQIMLISPWAKKLVKRELFFFGGVWLIPLLLVTCVCKWISAYLWQHSRLSSTDYSRSGKHAFSILQLRTFPVCVCPSIAQHV